MLELLREEYGNQLIQESTGLHYLINYHKLVFPELQLIQIIQI